MTDIVEDRENEFSANNFLSGTKPTVKKFRLKHKVTKVTKGIFGTKKEADSALDKHPERKNLVVENTPTFKEYSTEFDQAEVEIYEETKNNLRAAFEGLQIATDSSEFASLVEMVKALSESELAILAESNIETVSEVAQEILKESPFDWKGKPSEIEWNDKKTRRGTYGSGSHTEHTPEGSVPAEKRGRGRPAGSFNKATTPKLSRTPEQKKAIADKIWAARRAKKAAGGVTESEQTEQKSIQDAMKDLSESMTKPEAQKILDTCGGQGRDFHTLHSDHVNTLVTEAKKADYRKSKNANGSTARMFHAHLNRIASK